MKTCTKCNESKPREEFHCHVRTKDGLCSWCKQCRSANHRAKTHKALLRGDVVHNASFRKTCTKCGISKAAQDFNRDRGTVDGLKPRCKPCHAEQVKSSPLRKEYKRRDREKFPHKYKARTQVDYAIRSGKLQRKPCEVCGEHQAQAHHDDYSRPLDVIFLCRQHHFDRHAQLRREGREP